MKKIISLLFLSLFLSQTLFADNSTFTILSKDEIAKLSNEALIDAYIEASVELEAQKSFHTTSGFMPKDYNEFKNLLRYRILLVNEIRKRKLEVPQVE